MNLPESHKLDLSIARARIAMSLVAILSLYVDPSTEGGVFRLTADESTVALSHLVYASAVYVTLRGLEPHRYMPILSIAFDLFFATAISYVTHGQTGISYLFFVFAIVAAGSGSGSRPIFTVAFASVVLYLLVVVITLRVNGHLFGADLMRVAYLAVTGYVIGFFGRLRGLFEMQVRELEARADRQSIARSLHDGYVQALAGVNLRLETCRELLTEQRPQEALFEIKELQSGVAREYDEVREYLRMLAGIGETASPGLRGPGSNPSLQLRAFFTGRCLLGEHVLQIMLEGLRNARTHGMADLVKIDLYEASGKVSIMIEDDGIGLPKSTVQPWAIASRVAELEGHLNVDSNGRTRLSIELPNT